MTRRIKKFQIDQWKPENRVSMLIKTRIFSIQSFDNNIYLFAEVDCDEELTEERAFLTLPTEARVPNGLWYLGSVITSDTSEWHIYEVARGL